MNKVKREIGKRALVLVRSCCAGVATGDVRHTPCGQAARPDLDDGYAIRCASVLKTPSAPARRGRGAPTGHNKLCPSSLGPNRVSDRFGRRARLPNSPGGHPRPPRGIRIPAGSPAPPPGLPFALRPKGQPLWKPENNQHKLMKNQPTITDNIWNSMS